MPRLRLLGEAAGSRLSAALVDCDGHDGRSTEEEASGARVWFVMRGRFELRSTRKRRAADPATALLLHAGESFCIRHPESCGDVCLAVGGPAVDALVDRGVATAPVTSENYLRLQALSRRIARGDRPEPIELEEAICDAAGTVGPPVSATRFELRLADAVAHELAMRFDERLSLSELAQPHRVSVFAVCRAFRNARGTSVHRALQSLRVRHALAMMLDTSWTLARIAAECGFASHAHLTSLFRRELGIHPSALRRERLSP